MLASSAQASLVWRYAGSEYGKAKLACEKLLRTYAAETGAEALIYRFPNVFGKWCRPNYNSAVATFCHNIANDLPITVNDPATELSWSTLTISSRSCWQRCPAGRTAAIMTA